MRGETVPIFFTRIGRRYAVGHSDRENIYIIHFVIKLKSKVHLRRIQGSKNRTVICYPRADLIRRTRQPTDPSRRLSPPGSSSQYALRARAHTNTLGWLTSGCVPGGGGESPRPPSRGRRGSGVRFHQSQQLRAHLAHAGRREREQCGWRLRRRARRLVLCRLCRLGTQHLWHVVTGSIDLAPVHAMYTM